jgi:hypothetical protein
LFLRFKSVKFFLFFSLLKINIFLCFQIIWYADIKNNFLRIKKNIILMYFQAKALWKAIVTTLTNTPKPHQTIQNNYLKYSVLGVLVYPDFLATLNQTTRWRLSTITWRCTLTCDKSHWLYYWRISKSHKKGLVCKC